MNIFPIITGLKLPTQRRVDTVTMGSLTICFTIYAILGIFGYLTFFTRDKVSGNILLNYDVDQPEIVVGRFAVTLVVMFSYPILAHPCINSVDALLFPEVRTGLVHAAFSLLFAFATANRLVKRWYQPPRPPASHPPRLWPPLTAHLAWPPLTAHRSPLTLLRGNIGHYIYSQHEFSYQRRAAMVFVIVGITYVIAFFVTEVDLVLGIAGSLGEHVPGWSPQIGFYQPPTFAIMLPSPCRASHAGLLRVGSISNWGISPGGCNCILSLQFQGRLRLVSCSRRFSTSVCTHLRCGANGR